MLKEVNFALSKPMDPYRAKFDNPEDPDMAREQIPMEKLLPQNSGLAEKRVREPPHLVRSDPSSVNLRLRGRSQSQRPVRLGFSLHRQLCISAAKVERGAARVTFAPLAGYPLPDSAPYAILPELSPSRYRTCAAAGETAAWCWRAWWFQQ